MKGVYQGIPGKWFEDYSAVDGQRFIASPYGYRLMRNRLRNLVNALCEACGRYSFNGEVHHIYGRGFNGSKRDDRRLVNGVLLLQWLCRECHESAVIKPWGSWEAPISISATESLENSPPQTGL